MQKIYILRPDFLRFSFTDLVFPHMPPAENGAGSLLRRLLRGKYMSYVLPYAS